MTDTPDSTDPASRGTLHSVVDEGWAVGADDAAAAMSASSTRIVTTSEFLMRLSELLELASRQPDTVASRGERARGALVSPDFFDRACDALGEEPYARPPRTRLEELREGAKQIFELLRCRRVPAARSSGRDMFQR